MAYSDPIKARYGITGGDLRYKNLIQISPDGAFVYLDYSAIHLPNSKFSDLMKFIDYAFDHYKELHRLYPVKRDEKVILRLA